MVYISYHTSVMEFTSEKHDLKEKEAAKVPAKKKVAKVKKNNLLVVSFCSAKKDFTELSNFYPTNVMLSSTLYLSGEAAFHGSKLKAAADSLPDGSARKSELLAKSAKFASDGEYKKCTGAELKTRGGNGKLGLRLTPAEIAIWSSKSLEVQRRICLYKLEHDNRVKDTLAKTGQLTLVHSAMRKTDEKVVQDCFWEGRAKVVEGSDAAVVLGQNHLGKIWMEIRDVMRQ